MKRTLALFLAATLLVSGVAVAAKDDAFKINKRDFKKTYKVIALMPVEGDPYLEMSDAVKAMLEEEVTARLEKRGYTVLPSSVLAGIREEMTAQVGGVEDPATGQVDAAKLRAVRDHSYRELWFRHEFDAVASISVTIFQVPMESDRVEWDGVKQKLAYEGRGKKYSASVNVSSVLVAIYDAANKPLYEQYGGLEPIMYRLGEQLQPLTAEQLLRDEKKIRKAAQIAVSPI